MSHAQSLKDLAQVHGIKIGTAIQPGLAVIDPTYELTILREFNLMIPENNFKMLRIHPEKDVYNFTITDAIMDYAEANGLEVNGHTLIWGLPGSLPDWIASPTVPWTRETLLAVMIDHITTVVTRYAGRVKAWDVVNEAFCNTAGRQGVPGLSNDCIGELGKGGMNDSVWHKVIGPDFIAIALDATRLADPNAILYINENGIEFPSSKKTKILYTFVENLKNSGSPIDGIGFQMHIPLEAIGDISNLDAMKQDVALVFQGFNDLGLQTRVTELDVWISDLSYMADPAARLADQAQVYDGVLEVCIAASNCPSINMWGFTDKHSWIPAPYPGFGHAHIFDENYDPKPAYFSLVDILTP